MNCLDIQEIQRSIPQRFPMLMIDRIVNLDPGKRVQSVKNITVNEAFFQGHFPGEPVMPGVMIIEAMAQTSIFLLYDPEQPDKKLDLFLGVVKDVRFFKAVVPGDQLHIVAEPLRLAEETVDVTAQAFVGPDKVAEGRFICVRRKKNA